MTDLDPRPEEENKAAPQSAQSAQSQPEPQPVPQPVQQTQPVPPAQPQYTPPQYAQSAPPVGAPGAYPAAGPAQPPYPGAYPPVPPYSYPYQNPYPPRPRQKMGAGLKALIIALSVLFGATVLGFGAYGAFHAIRGVLSQVPADSSGAGDSAEEPPESFYDLPINPFGGGDGSFGAPYDRDDFFPMPETGEEYVAPDIDVTPNEGGLTLHPVPSGQELSIPDVYDKVIPSTVLVLVEGQDTGTGIIATADGYIITNSHVVSDTRAIEVQVKTNDGLLHDAVVVGCDRATDLAVLKIDGEGYTPAEFGDSSQLRMGQWVVAIGNPGGERFSGSVTRGIISGLDRAVGSYSESGMTYIQTDAAINPGNSGGPLVNLYGQVVGINSAKIVSSKYEGMGFAIPITGAKAILDDLLSGGYVKGRARFGIQGYAVTEYQAAMADVPQGFLITRVDEDGCFAGTDVRVYDIITAVGDRETPSLEALTNALLLYSPGDEVTVTLFRPNENATGGSSFTVTVTLLEDLGETQ